MLSKHIQTNQFLSISELRLSNLVLIRRHIQDASLNNPVVKMAVSQVALLHIVCLVGWLSYCLYIERFIEYKCFYFYHPTDINNVEDRHNHCPHYPFERGGSPEPETLKHYDKPPFWVCLTCGPANGSWSWCRTVERQSAMPALLTTTSAENAINLIIWYTIKNTLMCSW